TTKVGTPAALARCRPPASCRSDPTATTRAPYAGSAHASSSACRLVPVPDSRATRRAVTQGPYPSAADPGRSPAVSARGGTAPGGGAAAFPARDPAPRGAVTPATTVASRVPGVTRAAPNAPTSHGTGPVVARCPAPSAPPEAAAAPARSAPATGPATRAATTRAGHRVRPSRMRRTDHQAAVKPATVGTSSSAAPTDGSGPCGRPAKTGSAGSVPSVTSLLRTTVPAPTANPGPSR